MKIWLITLISLFSLLVVAENTISCEQNRAEKIMKRYGLTFSDVEFNEFEVTCEEIERNTKSSEEFCFRAKLRKKKTVIKNQFPMGTDFRFCEPVGLIDIGLLGNHTFINDGNVTCKDGAVIAKDKLCRCNSAMKTYGGIKIPESSMIFQINNQIYFHSPALISGDKTTETSKTFYIENKKKIIDESIELEKTCPKY